MPFSGASPTRALLTSCYKYAFRMVAAHSPFTFDARARPEQRIAIDRVPWKTYVLLRDAIDEPRFKMTYCEGVLELMSPSKAHELNKKGIARLLELYAWIARIRLTGTGSTTFKDAMKARGVEPDESWFVGPPPHGDVPHIVLEVIETRPLLDKLHVYDGLLVPEVWLLEAGRLGIHRRKSHGGYAKARRSAYFPALDPKLLEEYMPRADDNEALDEFAAQARRKRTKRRR